MLVRVSRRTRKAQYRPCGCRVQTMRNWFRQPFLCTKRSGACARHAKLWGRYPLMPEEHVWAWLA
jgi:hypothetical protein